MAVVTILSLVVLLVFYKEFLVTSFDSQFAQVAGFPTKLIHYGLMLMLAFAIVIALQAVGVVLVSAMLIIPAASAYLLTDRMHRAHPCNSGLNPASRSRSTEPFRRPSPAARSGRGTRAESAPRSG